ncbi:hypothetical protein L3X38_043903 [Prunus dulcis]|uniref:Uncharacterized protein n=1 Tax=Prunus dulcis TaxID=3755 RepID=A0AAD4UZB0_PRUDU|nr:hypothetical protein L3X38_043903 [Prunus dulcis]
MTRASSSSSPSRLPPPADVVSLENGEEAAGVVRSSPTSISLLWPPIPTSEIWFLTYFSCSSCLLGRIGSILSVANSILELKFSRFGIAIPATSGLEWHRLYGVETGSIRGVGCAGVWGDIVIVWHGRTWRRLSSMLAGFICGVGCTGLWRDIVIVWHGRTWRRLSGVLTGPIRGVGYTAVWEDYVKYRGMK